jgi:hypothetical protein
VHSLLELRPNNEEKHTHGRDVNQEESRDTAPMSNCCSRNQGMRPPNSSLLCQVVSLSDELHKPPHTCAEIQDVEVRRLLDHFPSDLDSVDKLSGGLAR